jgi:mono/diheme cytochrome c family protein
MAGPLTETVAQEFPGATVRRVTLRPRNPDHAADATDREVLERFAAAGAPESPAETVVWTETTGRYYRELRIQEVCLTCHGNPDRFPPDLAGTLRQLYPEDQATGYQTGELRGAVRVEIPR